MNKILLEKAGTASFGNTWQTDLSKRLSVTDRSIRNWLKSDVIPDIEDELIQILQNRKTEIDDAINEILQSDDELGLAYQFDKCSDAVTLLKDYYIKLNGYKLFEPSHPNGVFAVVIKNEDKRERLTVLDNRTIVKDSGNGNYKPYTKEDYDSDINEVNEIIAMSSQDE